MPRRAAPKDQEPDDADQALEELVGVLLQIRARVLGQPTAKRSPAPPRRVTDRLPPAPGKIAP